MAKWLLVVETNCTDEAREAEFNEWYDKIHIPDILEASGFIKATRYENTEPSDEKGKFLATYEIETDDIDKCINTFSEHMAKKRAEGRVTELLVIVPHGRNFYKELGSISK
ncbi:DUF4286 family protein [Chloroflexota bacterium]